MHLDRIYFESSRFFKDPKYNLLNGSSGDSSGVLNPRCGPTSSIASPGLVGGLEKKLKSESNVKSFVEI